MLNQCWGNQPNGPSRKAWYWRCLNNIDAKTVILHHTCHLDFPPFGGFSGLAWSWPTGYVFYIPIASVVRFLRKWSNPAFWHTRRIVLPGMGALISCQRLEVVDRNLCREESALRQMRPLRSLNRPSPARQVSYLKLSFFVSLTGSSMSLVDSAQKKLC